MIRPWPTTRHYPGLLHWHAPLQLLDPVAVERERLGQDFQRDITIQLGVAAPVHLAHAARAEGGRIS